ncbi:hypothetical protein HPB47_005918 [Ixodes persulcatus]|uniref:Uncharacterized protein n=1 Tax=Ixodes persulcatus TaxID=34615 RepID=A0AC60PBM9_IXOPE|nr:hypothetical protein HPB47_005918 [Ixodes persulcatus]
MLWRCPSLRGPNKVTEEEWSSAITSSELLPQLRAVQRAHDAAATLCSRNFRAWSNSLPKRRAHVTAVGVKGFPSCDVSYPSRAADSDRGSASIASENTVPR